MSREIGVEQPLLTVVVPVYNVAPYLERTLQSVIDAVGEWSNSEVRTHFDRATVEVICVDDGSTDGSGRILDKYVGRKGVVERCRCSDGEEGAGERGRRSDEGEEGVEERGRCSGEVDNVRFVVIHQKNAGVSAARNAALDRARGDWVMMLDGDDTWSSDLLVKLFENIYQYPDCDAVGFGMVRVDENGRMPDLNKGEGACCVTTGNDILMDGRGPMSHYIWASWDKIYKREVIEHAKLRYVPGIRVGEDSLFAQMFFAQAGMVVLNGRNVGYRYLMKDGSAIHQLEQRVPDELFPKFLPLFELWRRIGGTGLKTRLQLDAAAAPFIFQESRFVHIREEVLNHTIKSKIFNEVIIPFLVFHGRIKSRLFACFYLCIPCGAKKRLIRSLWRGK